MVQREEEDKAAIMEIGVRLQKYYQHKGLSKQQMADRMGVPSHYINRIMEGNNVSSEQLLAIRQSCPDLRFQWLLQGQGAMLKQGQATPPSTIEEQHQQLVAALESLSHNGPLHTEAKKAQRVKALLDLLQQALHHRGAVMARQVDVQLSILALVNNDR